MIHLRFLPPGTHPPGFHIYCMPLTFTTFTVHFEEDGAVIVYTTVLQGLFNILIWGFFVRAVNMEVG